MVVGRGWGGVVYLVRGDLSRASHDCDDGAATLRPKEELATLPTARRTQPVCDNRNLTTIL